MRSRTIQWAKMTTEGRVDEASGSKLENFYPITTATPVDLKTPVVLFSAPGQKRWASIPSKNPAGTGFDDLEEGIHALMEIESTYGNYIVGLSNQYNLFTMRIASDAEIPASYDGPDDDTALYALPEANVHNFSNTDTEDIIPAHENKKLVSDGRRVMWVTPNRVYMWDFGKQGGAGYVNVAAPTPSAVDSSITNLNTQDWVDCTWIDGYFILAAKSGEVWSSGINAATFDQLDFASAETQPDNIIGLEVLSRRLYVFGRDTIEYWYNSGNASGFAFDRDNSGAVNIGCASRSSIAKTPDRIMFLGSDGVVYAIRGHTEERISTEAAEYDIAQSDTSKARAFTYTEEGHRFYSLTLAMNDGTLRNWTFDLVSLVWHERTETGVLACVERKKSTSILLGKQGTNHIFKQLLDYGTIEQDDGTEAAIDRIAISPVIHRNLERTRVAAIHIDIPHRDGGEDDDHVVIDWSDDGKQTWVGGTDSYGNDQQNKLDNKGFRISRRRLGQLRLGRNFRIRTSAKRRVDMLGAYIEYTPTRDGI